MLAPEFDNKRISIYLYKSSWVRTKMKIKASHRIWNIIVLIAIAKKSSKILQTHETPNVVKNISALKIIIATRYCNNAGIQNNNMKRILYEIIVEKILIENSSLTSFCIFSLSSLYCAPSLIPYVEIPSAAINKKYDIKEW